MRDQQRGLIELLLDLRDLVTQHGELVLSAVEIWAQEGGKGLRNVNWPLAMFLKNADEFIEAAKQATEVQQAETKQEDVIAISIQAGQASHAEEEQKLAVERAEREEELRRVQSNEDGLFQS